MSLAEKSKATDYEKRSQDGSQSYSRLIGAVNSRTMQCCTVTQGLWNLMLWTQLEVCQICFAQEPLCIKMNTTPHNRTWILLNHSKEKNVQSQSFGLVRFMLGGFYSKSSKFLITIPKRSIGVRVLLCYRKN